MFQTQGKDMCPYMFFRRRDQGLTLVEVLMSTVLMSLLTLITVAGMILHLRMAQSNLAKQRMAESARRFIQGAQIAMMDPTIVSIDTGPAGAGTVLTVGRPDPSNAANVVYKQYAFIDGDKNPATIRDNLLVMRDTNAPMDTSGTVVAEYVSPVSGKSIFSQVSSSAYPLYEVNLRLGDKTNPPSAEDNALTGRGYQSYLINAFLAKGA